MAIKVMVGVVVLLAGLVVASLLSHKSVHTELVVDAAPEALWAVLVDAERYPAWNPVLVEATAGTLEVGQEMVYQLREPSGRQYELKAKVRRVEPNRELNQTEGIPGVLTFDHQYLFEAVEGGTKVTQHEEYRGIGVWFWDESWVEPAYASVNVALAEGVTQLSGTP